MGAGSGDGDGDGEGVPPGAGGVPPEDLTPDPTPNPNPNPNPNPDPQPPPDRYRSTLELLARLAARGSALSPDSEVSGREYPSAWFFPFAEGKALRKLGAPPASYLPRFLEAHRRAQRMLPPNEQAEALHRLHATRLKVLLEHLEGACAAPHDLDPGRLPEPEGALLAALEAGAFAPPLPAGPPPLGLSAGQWRALLLLRDCLQGLSHCRSRALDLWFHRSLYRLADAQARVARLRPLLAAVGSPPGAHPLLGRVVLIPGLGPHVAFAAHPAPRPTLLLRPVADAPALLRGDLSEAFGAIPAERPLADVERLLAAPNGGAPELEAAVAAHGGAAPAWRGLALPVGAGLGAAAESLAPLFDKRRPQIAAVWVKDTAEDCLGMLDQRMRKYVLARRKYLDGYACALEGSLQAGRLRLLLSWTQASNDACLGRWARARLAGALARALRGALSGGAPPSALEDLLLLHGEKAALQVRRAQADQSGLEGEAGAALREKICGAAYAAYADVFDATVAETDAPKEPLIDAEAALAAAHAAWCDATGRPPAAGLEDVIDHCHTLWPDKQRRPPRHAGTDPRTMSEATKRGPPAAGGEPAAGAKRARKDGGGGGGGGGGGDGAAKKIAL